MPLCTRVWLQSRPAQDKLLSGGNQTQDQSSRLIISLTTLRSVIREYFERHFSQQRKWWLQRHVRMADLCGHMVHKCKLLWRQNTSYLTLNDFATFRYLGKVDFDGLWSTMVDRSIDRPNIVDRSIDRSIDRPNMVDRSIDRSNMVDRSIDRDRPWSTVIDRARSIDRQAHRREWPTLRCSGSGSNKILFSIL